MPSLVVSLALVVTIAVAVSDSAHPKRALGHKHPHHRLLVKSRHDDRATSGVPNGRVGHDRVDQVDNDKADHKHVSGAKVQQAPVVRDEKGNSHPAKNGGIQAPAPIVQNDGLGFPGVFGSVRSILWKCSHLFLGSPAARMTRLKPIQLPDGLKPTELLIKRCEGAPTGQRLVGGLVIACNMRGNTPPKIEASGFHVRVVGQGPGGQRIDSYQFCEDSSPEV